MKKWIYLLLALPFISLTACDSDDDLPDVNFNFEYEGATKIDNSLYLVQGDTFAITSLTVSPVREGKKVAVTNVSYSFDGWFIGNNSLPPFYEEFDTSEMGLGNHVLGLTMNVIEVGCSPATAYFGIDLVVVGSAEDIPANNNSTISNSISGKPTIRN